MKQSVIYLSDLIPKFEESLFKVSLTQGVGFELIGILTNHVIKLFLYILLH